MIELVKKIIGKINYWNRKIVLFQWKPSANLVLINQDITYLEIKDISNSIFKQSLFPLQECKARFANGHVLCVLQNTNHALVSYGWINNVGSHYLGELNLNMKIPENSTVLYDFFTVEAFRGHGYYSNLLQCICGRDLNSKIIYALAGNTQSCKGILKAHFKLVGTISGLNKNNYVKMIAQ